MAKGVSQKCRLLLEGREVPFISASLICNIGDPITAVIDMVPLPVIKFIRPKTQVHIFVQDSMAFGDLNFYLAFEGEVVGRTMMKRDGSRAFQVQAVDYSGYWDESKAYFYNHNFLVGKIEEVATGGVAPGPAAKSQGATSLSTNSTLNSRMISILVAAIKDKSTDLIDGVVNVFKALNKINLFYSAAYERLRITDRIRVFSSGRIKAFLQGLNMEEFLLTYTGQQGGVVSLREMLVNVMALIFHDFVSVPFPSLVAVKENGVAKSKTIANFLFVPDGYTLPPPKCNVIFPNQIQSFEFHDDFRSAPTRFAFRASFPGFAAETTNVRTFPIQYYPASFKDYMFGTATETQTEFSSQLGTSTILIDPATGKNYASGIKYGDKGSKAVGGVSVAPILREADFLTNEESVRGVFFDFETFMPGMTTLASKNSAGSIRSFTKDIGTYLFFKKRFAARNCSGQFMFHPFLVPGFNSIVVDDSDAGQSFIAKIQTITHSLTNQGCSTSVGFGYARDFDEVDYLTGGSGEPPLPKWFDPAKFGRLDTKGTLFKAETDFLAKQGFLGPQADNFVTGGTELAARKKISSKETTSEEVTVFDKLSSFYQLLIGADSVTDVDAVAPTVKGSKLVTSRGASFMLTEKFKQLSNTPEARDQFVSDYVRRPIPSMAETMFFLGAKPKGTTGIIPDEFAVFDAVTTGPQKGRFDGKTTSGKNAADNKILIIRRQVIDVYVDLLKNSRGFRG